MATPVPVNRKRCSYLSNNTGRNAQLAANVLLSSSPYLNAFASLPRIDVSSLMKLIIKIFHPQA